MQWQQLILIYRHVVSDQTEFYFPNVNFCFNSCYQFCFVLLLKFSPLMTQCDIFVIGIVCLRKAIMGFLDSAHCVELK